MVDHIVDIGLDLVARREIAFPRVIFDEFILVEEIADIDPGFGIIVQFPSAANVGHAFDDPVANSQTVELDRRANAAEPGSDDDDREILQRFVGATVGPAHVAGKFVIGQVFIAEVDFTR